MTRLIYISLVLALLSCKSHKQVTKQTVVSSIKKDSIVYIDRVKVDTVKIPAEVIEVQVPLEVFKTDTVLVYNKGRVSTKLVSNNGVLNFNTRCDSLEKLVLSTEKILIKERKAKDKLIEKSKSKEVIVKSVGWYYKASLFIVIAIICGVIIYLLIKYINPISRFT